MTQADCQQKKAAYDQAVAEVTMAKQNALDFGPDLPGNGFKLKSKAIK